MTNAVVTQVVNHLESMPLDLQEQVLAFVQSLDTALRRGVAGQQLVRFAGKIDEDDLDLMSHAIEEGCERVDLNEW